MHNRGFHIVAVILLIVVGLSVRLINLGDPGFGTDEPLHVFAAKGILETGETEMPSGLYYNRAKIFSEIVAVSFKYLGVSEFSARLPSVIFGTATILVIYLIGKNLFGAAVGLLSALILAFLPYEIAWSKECRMYALFQMCFLIGAFSFYKGMDAPANENGQRKRHQNKAIAWLQSNLEGFSVKWIIVAFLFLYLSIKLQKLAVLFFPAVCTYLLLVNVITLVQHGHKEMLQTKHFKLLMVFILAGLIALILMPSLVDDMTGMLWFSPAWAKAHKFNPLYYIHTFSTAEMFPIGFLFLIGSLNIILRNNKVGLYLFLLVIVPMIILTFIPSGARGTRYIYNLFPLMILISAYTLSLLLNYEYEQFIEKYKEKGKKVAQWVYGALVICFIAGLSVSWVYYAYHITFNYYDPRAQMALTHKNWPAGIEYINSHKKEGDIFITSEPLAATYYGIKHVDYFISSYLTLDDPLNIGVAEGIYEPDRLKEIVDNNRRGWMLIDAGRFNTDFRTSPKLRDFIYSNCDHHTVSADKTMFLFSWGVNEGS